MELTYRKQQLIETERNSIIPSVAKLVLKTQYRSFYPDIHLVKLNKKEVGQISEKSGEFRVRLKVIKTAEITDSNDNCPWKMITLKKKCDSLQDMKDFLNEHIKSILKTYTLNQ